MIQFKKYTLEQALIEVGNDEAKAAYKQDTDGSYVVGIACYDDFYAIESVATKQEANAIKSEYEAALQADKSTILFYTLDELLPFVDESSRVLSKKIDDNYIAGVEHDGAFFAMFTSTDAEAADVYASEMQKVLEERFAPILVDDSEETEAETNDVTAGLYSLDQVIPMVDGSARSYCDLVVDVYVVGVSYRYDKYPIATVTTAEEADNMSADIDRLIDETYKTPTKADPADDDAALLEGFLPSPNRGLPRIKVGVNRLFLSGDIEKQLGIERRSRVILAYRPRDESIAIIKPSTPSLTEEMRAGGYFVSAKKDIACARLFRDFGLYKHEGKRFYADKTSLSGNVVIFRR